jgi:hypothetical protein
MTQKRKITIIGLLMLLFAAMNCNAQVLPTAGIVVEKMNVLYAGIPNPVTIVSSVPYEKLRISWGGATVTSLGGGRYNINVPSSFVGRELSINISAELEKGKIVSLGSTLYRVKSVPTPNVFVGGNIVSGEYGQFAILANPFISARFDTNFDYEMKLRIISYKVTFNCEEPITINGEQFGEIVTEKIQNAPSGTIVVFSDIKIQFAGEERDIPKRIVISIK